MVKKPIAAIVGSWSMIPLFNKGDKIFLQETNHDDLSAGDIICFRRQQGLVVHRLLRISRDGQGHKIFITRSDKTGKTDLPIIMRDIIGKVVAFDRRGQKVSLKGGVFFWWGKILVFSWNLHPRVPLLLNNLVLKTCQWDLTKNIVRRICYNNQTF